VLGCGLVGYPANCQYLRANALITIADSQFGQFIEGASTNPSGHIFAVNYGNATTLNFLGSVHPKQHLFYQDSVATTSHFNGIRFLNDETAFVVDVVNHRVVQLTVSRESHDDGDTYSVSESKVLCQNNEMLQPNDLTLSKEGTVFLSGMRWLSDTNASHGDIWTCLPNGQAIKLEVMGRTNGIDLSPDEKLLYVSESYNRGGTPYVQKIWVYDVNVKEGKISGKRLFKDFEFDSTQHIDIDGMKTDVDGNLFVTRHSGGQVVVFDPEGNLVARISLNFENPTNLEFGGDDGRTLFVVGECGLGGGATGKGCVDTIQLVKPGRSWSILQSEGAANGAQKSIYISRALVAIVLLVTSFLA